MFLWKSSRQYAGNRTEDAEIAFYSYSFTKEVRKPLRKGTSGVSTGFIGHGGIYPVLCFDESKIEMRTFTDAF